MPLRHDDVVVDIGAFIGQYAIRCATFPVRKVIAYEPAPRSFAELTRSIQLPNFEAVRAAVVPDERQQVPFFLSSGIGVRNRLRPSTRLVEISVPAVSYARAIAEATVVKIDVEGAEYDLPIVEQMPPGLRAIAIEFHPVGRDWRQRAEAIVAGLEAAGFTALRPPTWRGLFSSSGSWLRHDR